LIAVFAALALAACGLIPSSRTATTASPPDRADGTPPFAAGAAPAPGADTQTARIAPGTPTAPTGPLDDDPSRVMGLDQDGLQKLLGTPAFMRRDASAQLWRYTARGCVLDMFLYRNGVSGPFVVKHLTARNSTGSAPGSAATGAEINPRTCLGPLLRARVPSAAG
jgi:hypothetical protein